MTNNFVIAIENAFLALFYSFVLSIFIKYTQLCSDEKISGYA